MRISNVYFEFIEILKAAVEFRKDQELLNRCQSSLQNYCRAKAIDCLEDTLHAYRNEINTFGALFDGIRIIHTAHVPHDLRRRTQG